MILRTGVYGEDGQEEQVSEYLCDWPGCVNTATRVIGVAVELGASVVACPEHAARLASRAAERARQ